ncbi:hypothetical protein FOA43_002945 [Brettanomyces nanus]|uniref:Mitochondrial distribution and morphology protein 10 n=1 Tax=Eeniella nana TaxID=13502 RepID=A0A875S3Q5_EENNA|nr:uncharacterized protein FOA43_002945 [Brettanomyces nanus]QPG75588.1 hypothetical protein FOA43_002945 [Brettanomyces nanus]
MDYVQKCFYDASGWNDDLSYEQILRTSNNLMHFPIPSGFKLSISSKNTEYSYSSLTLSQLSRLTGSLSYLYSSIDLKNTYLGTASLPLRLILDDYRFVKSPQQQRLQDAHFTPTGQPRPCILYGKMYFPSQFLEGMLIKRISKNVQLMMKFINTPKLRKLANNSTIVTLYLQRQKGNSSTDFIFSSNESLLGFRCLYKIGSDLSSSPGGISDSTSLSLGFELWFALMSMSPGLSTALRYSTHLSSSGKPLTMTLALNPLLGTIESTYAIKSGLNSTLSSKYTFNIYSYESDLLFGFSLLRSSEPPNRAVPPKSPLPSTLPITSSRHQPFKSLDEETHHRLLTTFMGINPGKLVTENNARHFMDTFNHLNFSSGLKCCASIAKKDLNVAWEGRFKDLLISSGLRIDCSEAIPKMGKYGIEIQYSS